MNENLNKGANRFIRRDNMKTHQKTKTEKRLIDFWNLLRRKATITISNWETLNKYLSSVFEQWERREARLIQSRDRWKDKYFKMKNGQGI